MDCISWHVTKTNYNVFCNAPAIPVRPCSWIASWNPAGFELSSAEYWRCSIRLCWRIHQAEGRCPAELMIDFCQYDIQTVRACTFVGNLGHLTIDAGGLTAALQERTGGTIARCTRLRTCWRSHCRKTRYATGCLKVLCELQTMVARECFTSTVPASIDCIAQSPAWS